MLEAIRQGAHDAMIELYSPVVGQLESLLELMGRVFLLWTVIGSVVLGLLLLEISWRLWGDWRARRGR